MYAWGQQLRFLLTSEGNDREYAMHSNSYLCLQCSVFLFFCHSVTVVKICDFHLAKQGTSQALCFLIDLYCFPSKHSQKPQLTLTCLSHARIWACYLFSVYQNMRMQSVKCLEHPGWRNAHFPVLDNFPKLTQLFKGYLTLCQLTNTSISKQLTLWQM